MLDIITTVNVIIGCCWCCIFSNSDFDRLAKVLPAATYIINGSERLKVSYTDDQVLTLDNGRQRVELEGQFRVNYRLGRVDVMVFDPHRLGDLSTIMCLQFSPRGDLTSIAISSVMVNSRGRQTQVFNTSGAARRLPN